MAIDQVRALNEPAGVRPSLLSVLVRAGVASEDDVRLAHAEAMGSGERLGQVVLRRGWLDEAGLGRALAEQWGVPFLGEEAELDAEALTLLDPATARELGVCPVTGAEGRLTVAVSEPTTDRVRAVREKTGSDPLVTIVAPATLERLLAEAAEHGVWRMDSQPVYEDGSAADMVGALELELQRATEQLVAVRERVGKFVAESAQTRDDRERLALQAREAVEALEAAKREREAARAEAAALRETIAERDAEVAALKLSTAEMRDRIESLRAAVADVNRLLN